MPTHYRGTAQERAALDAYIKLMRAADSVTARLDPLMRADDLTVGRVGRREALVHRGPLCQRDLGRKLLRSGGNITVVVGNLARRGLVRRHRGPQDRRFVTVTLTDKGRRLIGGIFPRHLRHVVRELEALSPPEQAELGRLFRQPRLPRPRERPGKERRHGTQTHPPPLALALSERPRRG